MSDYDFSYKNASGYVRKAYKTKSNQPDLKGVINFKRNFLQMLLDQIDAQHSDNITCNLAAWKKSEDKMSIVVSAPVVPKKAKVKKSKKVQVYELNPDHMDFNETATQLGLQTSIFEETSEEVNQ